MIQSPHQHETRYAELSLSRWYWLRCKWQALHQERFGSHAEGSQAIQNILQLLGCLRPARVLHGSEFHHVDRVWTGPIGRALGHKRYRTRDLQKLRDPMPGCSSWNCLDARGAHKPFGLSGSPTEVSFTPSEQAAPARCPDWCSLTSGSGSSVCRWRQCRPSGGMQSALGRALHHPQDHGPAEQNGQGRNEESFVFERKEGHYSMKHDVLPTLSGYTRAADVNIRLFGGPNYLYGSFYLRSMSPLIGIMHPTQKAAPPGTIALRVPLYGRALV